MRQCDREDREDEGSGTAANTNAHTPHSGGRAHRREGNRWGRPEPRARMRKQAVPVWKKAAAGTTENDKVTTLRVPRDAGSAPSRFVFLQTRSAADTAHCQQVEKSLLTGGCTHSCNDGSIRVHFDRSRAHHGALEGQGSIPGHGTCVSDGSEKENLHRCIFFFAKHIDALWAVL